MTDPGPDLVVFDGVCVLCNGVARFVLRFDRAGRWQLATAQSPLGQVLCAAEGLSPDALETFLVRRNGRVLHKSDAVMALLADLGWPWRVASIGRLLPRGLRDLLYDRVAGNRYRLFGRHESCPIPSADQLSRFAEGGH